MTRAELEEKILQIVNDSGWMSYSDIQAVVQALVMEAIPE
jgi:hypothetical protein